MINPDYIRTMAEYNAEMNRRLYGAAARLSDPEQRLPRGAFWGSIHGTLTHILTRRDPRLHRSLLFGLGIRRAWRRDSHRPSNLAQFVCSGICREYHS